jgi:hypothetical protein
MDTLKKNNTDLQPTELLPQGAVSKSLFLNGRGFEKTESETGAGISSLSPYAKNKSGNKDSSYRRKIIYVFRFRDNSICPICGHPAHNVHHILSKRDYPHWKKEFNNLISLCFHCHNLADADFFSTEYLFQLIL